MEFLWLKPETTRFQLSSYPYSMNACIHLLEGHKNTVTPTLMVLCMCCFSVQFGYTDHFNGENVWNCFAANFFLFIEFIIIETDDTHSYTILIGIYFNTFSFKMKKISQNTYGLDVHWMGWNNNDSLLEFQIW